MSYFSQTNSLASLLKEGSRQYSGLEESMLRNIEAIAELASIVRTSLGPNGMRKFILNHLDKLILTKDSGVMLKELEVNHPAAKLIADASKIQESEMGDNTNFVITFAGELLNQAQLLIKSGLHPHDIFVGFEKAFNFCFEFMDQVQTYMCSDLKNKEEVAKLLHPIVASKLQSAESEILTPLVAEACIAVWNEGEMFNVENVRIAKMLGSSVFQSQMMHGLVILRQIEGAVQKAEHCKVAVYNCPLDTLTSETKDTVLFKTADELLNYSASEEKNIELIIKAIVDSGVKAVIVGGSISDMALHFLDKYGLLVFRTLSKFEIKRIALSVGATLLVRLGPPTPEEIGFADCIRASEVGSTKCIIIEKEANKLATVLIRASTQNMLDNVEKAVEQAVKVYQAMTKSLKFFPGAGAIEMTLSNAVKAYSKSISGLDQYAFSKFGEAFEIVPRMLAENSGLNVNEVLANLFSKNSDDERMGIDIKTGDIRNAFELGVFDHAEIKKWAIKFAVDAVLTVLKIDQIIVAKPSGGPKLDAKPKNTEEDEFQNNL